MRDIYRKVEVPRNAALIGFYAAAQLKDILLLCHLFTSTYALRYYS